MESLESNDPPYIMEIGIPPNEADIAIVSIDNLGTPGRLNSLVLKEYGYSEDELPNEKRLISGFDSLTGEKRKEILFVVTVAGDNTNENLEKNLYNALIEFRGWITGKKVWLPLLGTGVGELSLEESYIITNEVILRFQNEYPTQTTILLSLPDSKRGRDLMKMISGISLSAKTNTKALDNESIFDGINNNSYAVHNHLRLEDQTDLFIRDSFWELGLSNTEYTSTVKNVQPNDIFFLYELRPLNSIIAVGLVIRNPANGTSLKVNWILKKVAIKGLISGEAIQLLQKTQAIDLLKQLNSNQLQKLINAIKTTTKNETKEYIAGLISDSDKGIDYLNITKDVNAFARVAAAKSFEPPLAIALFGKWGSGKSFFMRKLKEQISTLSVNKTKGIYCEGIAHIHFNAWSYMDSNLWASIVTKIFEELNEYISEHSKTDAAKKEIEKQLTNQLSITKEEIGILEYKKNALSEKIDELQQKRNTIDEALDKKIKEGKSKTIWKIIKQTNKEFNAKEKIIKALNQNDSYIKTADELKRVIPDKYWDNPDKTYELAKSKYTFLKEFFRRDQIKSNIIWLSIILLIIVLTPFLFKLALPNLRAINFQIPQVALSLLITGAAIWKRAETVFNHLQPLIASFWKVKVSHENLINEATSKFEQEEKALKLEIEKGKSEVLLIEEQIQKIETIKTDLEYRIDNAFATEALYSFIDRRSKSDDYKKHLGLISIIRRDFEILNDLFNDHNIEAEKIKTAEVFRSNFKKPLERIILYIDDLDRCPEENVVQVLDAVNLLMAFPLFVVIVGVDSRWVKNALIKKHAFQFTGQINDNETTDNDIEIIEPSDYLEKIFQVPFHLKDAENSSVKDMIKELAQSKEIIESDDDETYANEENRVASTDSDTSNSPKVPDKTQPNPMSSPSKIADTISLDNPEVLQLTTQEIELMQDMSEVIGNNPRAIKRYVNVFRIIKAHEEFEYINDSSNEELLAILFLLAIPLGIYRKLLPSFEAFIHGDQTNLKEFRQYLQSAHKVEGFDALKLQLDETLTDRQSFHVLQNTASNVFKKHNGFINRFTFKQL